MAHRRVVNGLLSMYERPSYLEVGVYEGLTFIPARAGRKVAVDPRIRFTREAAESGGGQVELHEMTSDRYFGEVARGRERFDVIFLDGLHTLEQTLRDLLNATELLTPQGVILIDDVRPDSEVAGLADWSEVMARRNAGAAWNGNWMGDCYRLVFFIDSFMQGWSHRCTNDNLGQLVMWRAARPAVTERKVGEVAALAFEAVEAQPEAFRFAPFSAIRDEAARALGLPRGILPYEE